MLDRTKSPLPDEWICTKEVARRTSSSVSKWEKDRCKGVGCAYAKIGSKVLYNWPVVVAYMEANGRPPR
jgi:hypothetical protein